MRKQVFILLLLLQGCGGGDDSPSKGLKIFVTNEQHSGDFAGDSTLHGANAIQKADAFCNASSAKPSADNYKALIVDGVTRDAASKTDWVLKPNMEYYQAFNDILIDKTTNDAIFAAYYRPMPNPIEPCHGSCDNGRNVWTGMDDASTFAASSNTCNQWGQAGAVSGTSGAFASSTESGYYAFASNGGSAGCVSSSMVLYCVQQ